MPSGSLYAQPVTALVEECVVLAQSQTGNPTAPRVVISPYRFNPLGAHIDHQGGSVLARCLNQYTILCFWPAQGRNSTIHAKLPDAHWQQVEFSPSEVQDVHGWDAMARASSAALSHYAQVDRGIDAVVFGTLISGGLSSSASVILAYLTALADVNEIELTMTDLVELSRRVENDYRGLNNGIQDQMSIAFGQRDHVAVLDVEGVSAQMVPDPNTIDEVRFLMCYSGVSRDLGGSPFNTRVAECQQAAQSLYSSASHLGQVPESHRSPQALAKLPSLQARRARHVYTEMARVHTGAQAWQQGDWNRFGQLMDESCQSSINDYESGSEWLIALHEIARQLPGVYGNRFSGGGYGGCLFMLVSTSEVESIADAVMSQYLDRYPDRKGLARVLIAESEGTVRIVSS